MYIWSYYIARFNEFRAVLCDSNAKLTLWSNLKTNYHLEPYLVNVSDFKKRKAITLTKLRLSAHKLQIEIGRFTQTPRHLRICNMCSTDEIGDELHLLFACSHPEIQLIRNQLLQDINKISPAFVALNKSCKLIYLLSCKDIDITNVLSKYAYKFLGIAST